MRQDAGSALYVISDLNLSPGRRIPQHIGPGAELDHADALSTLHLIAYFFGEHDSPRQQSRNLLEHQSLTAALHSDDILLILLSAIHTHRVEEFPFLVNNFPNHALHRRAIHVYINHAQEDTDTTPAAAVLGGRDIGDFTV